MFNIFKKEKSVEVCRSFAYKLNVGNYESRDFFCSQKAEVPEKEAEKTSEALFQFCKNEVIKSIKSYQSLKPGLTNKPQAEQEKSEALKKETPIEEAQRIIDEGNREEQP